jgi:methionyl-tRNA formyltransferase
MKRIGFMGTPPAAVPALRALAERYEIPIVITQPDRPRGRSRKPEASPVKTEGTQLGLTVAQPESSLTLKEALVDAAPLDAVVVVAYGRIIRPEALSVPKSGMINVHFSLLPRWRGAAPVNRAVMAGDPMTGVTLMKMDEGLDTGPVITAQAVDIGPTETAGQLTVRLADIGANLLRRYLDDYLAGDVTPVTQSDQGLTYAAKIERSDRPISLSLPPADVVNHVRGLAPAPGATLDIDGEVHKIFEVTPAATPVPKGHWLREGSWPVVGLAAGSVRLIRLQGPGRTVMTGDAWARGRASDRGRVA